MQFSGTSAEFGLNVFSAAMSGAFSPRNAQAKNALKTEDVRSSKEELREKLLKKGEGL